MSNADSMPYFNTKGFRQEYVSDGLTPVTANGTSQPNYSGVCK